MTPVTYEEVIGGGWYIVYERMSINAKVLTIGKCTHTSYNKYIGSDGDTIRYQSTIGERVRVDDSDWGVYPNGMHQDIFKLDNEEVHRHILMEIL